MKKVLCISAVLLLLGCVLAGASPSTKTVVLPGKVPLEMVWCPPGTFMMGAPTNEQDSDAREAPQHQVTLTHGFWMGKYEVTQAQWLAVMGSKPSNHTGDLSLPVEPVSWDDCQKFATALNALGQGTFRLPTEAEWEYAYRAGTTTRFYWGDDPSGSQSGNYAWYYHNSGLTTHPVGGKLANAWGLYDMSGNAYEWCQDWDGSYATGAISDPGGPSTGSLRVLRGGDCYDASPNCRAALRLSRSPDRCFNDVGLRLVWTP